jgi:hypothetical protein
MSEWLIPWTQRGRSGPVRDNLLWRNDRVYVMDNHRLALWCWWQHLDESAYWTFHHVDRHYDALWEKANPWPKHIKDEHRISIDAFRSARWASRDGDFDLYRWDTITSSLFSLHGDQILETTFATNHEGDRPALARAQDIAPWSLPSHFRSLAEREKGLTFPRIIDIDVDYFTHQDLDGPFGQVFSDTFIRELGDSIRIGLDNGQFGIVTIALSPETTGSWPLAERILQLLLEPLGMAGEFASAAP